MDDAYVVVTYEGRIREFCASRCGYCAMGMPVEVVCTGIPGKMSYVEIERIHKDTDGNLYPCAVNEEKVRIERFYPRS